MLLTFLKERISWIIFFLTLQVWLNIILTLDVAFKDVSLLYINMINAIAFLLFLVWRFRKETQYIKSLQENLGVESSFDRLQEVFPEGSSSFEKKVTEVLEDCFRIGIDELNDLKVKHLEEDDQIVSWIHEVKTPLTSMKLMIDSLEDSKMQRKLELEWLRIHLLLDQQLHHTRLSSLEKDYIIEQVNLKKVVYQEIKELQGWCIQKNIGFDIDDLQKTVLTDQKWLAFILRQIISNGVKYSKENSIIQLFLRKDSVGHQLLTIQDFGCGIRQADLPRIFNRAFTGTTGRETNASTGMGLYLAKNAADKLGIKISVQSKVNEGTSFILQFPLKNEMSNILGR